jgi:hypothetical protein
MRVMLKILLVIRSKQYQSETIICGFRLYSEESTRAVWRSNGAHFSYYKYFKVKSYDAKELDPTSHKCLKAL